MGQSVTFFNRRPHILWQVEGMGLPVVNVIRSEGTGLDGYSFEGVTLGARSIKIKGHIMTEQGQREMYRLRRELGRIMSPVLGLLTLTYSNDYSTWTTKIVVTKNPYESRMKSNMTLTLEGECPDPYWYEEAVQSHKMLYIEGGFEFPFEFPIEFGIRGYQLEIQNDTNVFLPLRFEVAGGCVRPLIRNETTGEEIKINRTIPDDTYLLIHTKLREKKVLIVNTDGTNPVNAFGYVEQNSQLFMLRPGLNRLYFDSEDNSTTAQITVSYQRRWAAV